MKKVLEQILPNFISGESLLDYLGWENTTIFNIVFTFAVVAKNLKRRQIFVGPRSHSYLLVVVLSIESGCQETTMEPQLEPLN